MPNLHMNDINNQLYNNSNVSNFANKGNYSSYNGYNGYPNWNNAELTYQRS